MQDKITRSARGEACSLRVPGVCNFNRETTVFAHAPSRSSGMSKKSENWWGAYACSGCHDFMDGRAISPYLDSSDKPGIWLDGIHETQQKLIAKGLMPQGDKDAF
jgi:hypothetical protein